MRVVYENEEGVENALKADGEKFMERSIKVVKMEGEVKKGEEEKEEEKEFKLFFGNLQYKTKEESLVNLIKKYKPLSVKLMTNEEGKSKGFAFATFESEEQMVKVMTELNNTEFEGRELHVERVKSKKRERRERHQKPSKRKQNDPTQILFIANIPFDIDEKGIMERLKKFEPKGCRLLTSKHDGSSKGVAFVDFASVEVAENAKKELEGTKWDQRPLRIDFSGPMAQSGENNNENNENNNANNNNRKNNNNKFNKNKNFKKNKNKFNNKKGKK